MTRFTLTKKIVYAMLVVGFTVTKSYQSSGPCKAVPNTPLWPSQAQWNALNASISGQLLAPLPPAASCDPSLPIFNNATCSHVTALYTTSNFHAQDPLSVMEPHWQNDSCMPSVGAKCSVQDFPRYVVNATEASHVKAAVDFARERNVRLIVKGTGHDYLGRSTAPDSLSIWTHNIRGLQWHDDFVPQECSPQANSTIPAITAGAGHRMFEIYDTVAAHNSMIVGGEDPDVGLGGYLTGGGHSLISAHYGLAADNILEFGVVTPSGDIMTINQCMNQDLFFAFRGGGGSTFGVIISATFATLPTPSMAWSHFTITQPADTTNTSSFWLAIAFFHSRLPYLVENGMMGYYNVSNVSPANTSTSLQLEGGFWILNATQTNLDRLFNPILDSMHSTYGMEVHHSTQLVPDMYKWWKVQYPAGAVATINSQLGSRLLDEKALSLPLPQLAEALKTAYPDLVLLGNLVSGPGVWNARPPGGLGSMTPAWRKAVVHLIIPVTWPFHAPALKDKQTDLLTTKYVASLRKIAPDSGCYLNEADVNEPDLSHAFWGDNYEKLLTIKRQVDPEGVLWCSVCVGREDWTINQEGRVCKA